MSDALTIDLRLAEPSDSAFLAKAAVGAGGGIYEHLLAKAIRGLQTDAALATAIAHADDGLTWRNAILAEDEDGHLLGAAVAYPGQAYRLPSAILAAASDAAKRDLAPLFASQPPADSYYLHAIWTHPDARGRGVGRLLLDAVTAFGADQGFSRVSLHVWRDNAPAMALYKSRGFKLLETLDVPRRPLLPHDGGKLLMATDAA